MFNILKMDLENNDYDNHIYFGLTLEELKEINTLLKNDYGFIDLVLDFSDINRLYSLIESIPDHLDNERIKGIIYEQYICYKLLEQISIPRYLKIFKYKDIEDVKKIIFSNNFEQFANMKFLNFGILERDIAEDVKEENKRARLHIFFDKVNDKVLQRFINTMIGSRMSIAVMGYSSKEELITYNTEMNQVIENPHDYCAYHKEEFYARLRKKYNLE
ncbi:MAG: hypothetical protein E7163_03165 [Firmicutes bacterium]|nr:hypothetical protein [Bacillota bacterium]